MRAAKRGASSTQPPERELSPARSGPKCLCASHHIPLWLGVADALRAGDGSRSASTASVIRLVVVVKMRPAKRAVECPCQARQITCIERAAGESRFKTERCSKNFIKREKAKSQQNQIHSHEVHVLFCLATVHI